MRALFLLLIFTGIGVHSAFGQIFGTITDAPRSLALSRSDVADVHDEWVPNPALRIDTASHLRVTLWPAPLSLPGSYSAGVAGDIPLDSLWLTGASFSRYQWSDSYSWQFFGVQASRVFNVSGAGDSGRHAVAGIRLRYAQENFGTDYLPLSDIGVDLGASLDLFPRLTLAAAVTHLVSLYNSYGDSVEDREAWLGLSYRPTNDLTIDAAFESSEDESPAFLGGVEYALDSHIYVRAGTDTGNREISAGIGVIADSFSADFAAIRHPDLGTSISIAIGFAL
jgi:hypothetical protein